MLSRTFSNAIAGMPHGGCSAKMRKALTDFGSPWRGLIGVPQKLLNKIVGSRVAAASIGLAVPEILGEASKYWGRGSSQFAKFAAGIEQATRAGQQSMVFIPISRKGIFGREIAIKYRGKRFLELKSLVRHERTHQFNPIKGELQQSVAAHFKKNRLPPAAHEKLRSLGYEGQVYDEMLAVASEIRYRDQFTKGSITALRKRSKNLIAAYGDDVFMEAVKLARNEGVKLTKGRVDLMRRGHAIHRTDLSMVSSMQHTTEMVKANLTGHTVPGLAMHPRRGGSRQGPQGGT